MADVPHQDSFTPLFASDLAEQVRASFEEMISFGGSVTAATQETIARFQGALSDPLDGPVVILSLAALQIRQHEMHSSIRDAALELLEAGEAEKLIAIEPVARNKVREILAEMHELLESLEVEDDEDEEDEDEA